MVEPFIGSIQYFAFSYAPSGWSQCNGQSLVINQYQALFSLLSNRYGGDGVNNFNLPDYRGRAILGAGNSDYGINYAFGQNGGAESVTIPLAALPAHTHQAASYQVPAVASSGTTPISVNNIPAETPLTTPAYSNAAAGNNINMASPIVSIEASGSGAAIPVLPPYLALNCCIAITGYYPSRP